MDKEAISKFIESWGRMGAVWGINTSIARVHAILIVTEEPLSLDDIAKQLKISRGNASMCLRELRNWTIIKLVRKPGDRQDYYETESDVWKIFIAIAKERKRREFDPVLQVVKGTLPYLQKNSSATVKSRLEQMDELLIILDLIAERFLADEEKARYLLSFLSNFSKEK